MAIVPPSCFLASLPRFLSAASNATGYSTEGKLTQGVQRTSASINAWWSACVGTVSRVSA